MKITLPLVFETIHALALAVWVGGQTAFIVLLGIGIGTVPHTFVVREQSLMEYAGIVMVCIQYLTRHKYKKIKTLFVANSVRNLFTFSALILSAYVMNSVKGKSLGVLENQTIAYVTAAGQIGLLTAVSAITMWLLAATARISAAAADMVNTESPVTPAFVTPAVKQPTVPQRPVQKRRTKR